MATYGAAVQAPREVQINLDPNTGKFTYGGAGDPVYVPQGEAIKWVCGAGPFLVHFDGSTGSPCDQDEYPGQQGQSVQARVRTNAKNGTYKYIVGVWANGRIFIDDPQMIVP